MSKLAKVPKALKSLFKIKRQRFDLIVIALVAQAFWIVCVTEYAFFILQEVMHEYWVLFSSIHGYVIVAGQLYLIVFCEVAIIYILLTGLKGKPIFPSRVY